MKGLIRKDFYLIKNYMNYKFLILIVLAYLFTTFVSPSSATFLCAWFYISLSMLTITCMAYDERAGWNGYALSMPVTRKMIVKSKYIFSLLLILFGAALSLLLILIFSLLNKQTDLAQSLSALPAALFFIILFNSILIPVNLKYGTEKARNVFLILVLLPAAIAMLIGKNHILPKALVEKAVDFFLQYQEPLLTGLAWAAVFLLPFSLLVSYFISLRIVRKKEF